MIEQEKRGKRFKVELRYPYPSAQMIAEGGCEGKCEACEGKMVCWKNYFEEQEKHEKAIEEITKRKLKIIDYYGQHKQEIDKMREDIMSSGCSYTALPFMCCIYARIAGYRKEEEVRKEMEAKLKRLLLVLCNRRHNYYQSIDSYCVSEKVVKLDDIKEQFKEFGVEVEE